MPFFLFRLIIVLSVLFRYRAFYVYSPKKETQHVEKYNFQHHFKYRNKHYITLTFGTLVVQTLKFIKMASFITLKSIPFR